ncbi:MAG: hypothetical protein JWO35_815 [Candidatus Saccharibacteria bacterium]|nr:hypothetical protein [Candidatus Saccharibacteria bacterium]
MRQRSIVKMILLSLVTFGIYSLYWSISTKNEMNRLGANVPTAWLLIIPFVSIYWLWKYSEAVDQVTSNKVSAPLAFVVEAFLGFVGDLVIQSEFNKLATASAGGTQFTATQPDNSFGGPTNAAPAAAPSPAPVAPEPPVAVPTAVPTPVTITEAPVAAPAATPIAVTSGDSSQPQAAAQTPPQVQ